ALPPLEKAEDPRDLAEHLRRAGAAKEKAAKEAAAEAKATPKAPKKAESKTVPPKPEKDAALAAAQVGPSRRSVLMGVLTSWVFWGWATFTGGLTAFTLMSLRFMFPNVLAEPPSTIKVGLPSNFEEGEVNERWKAEWGFWIVRNGGIIYAIQSVCTHL